MTPSRLHLLDTSAVAGIELPKQFTWPFHYVPHPLATFAASRVNDYISCQPQWHDELRRGKMLGVLVVSDTVGRLGFVAAFSGLLAGRNDHDYFVPPIYDLLAKDGVFKTGEEQLNAMSHHISGLEKSADRAALLRNLTDAQEAMQREVEAAKQAITVAKKRRHELRATQALSDSEQQALLLESQHEKAEYKRLRKRHQAIIYDIQRQLGALDDEIAQLRRQRHALSERLQQQLFALYTVHNARGECRNVASIFAPAIPPGGTGECCAPKLLEYAYRNALRPVCMAEWWWGDSPQGEVRHHGHYYPACRSKCLPMLTFMLQGLDVEANQLATPVRDAELYELYDDAWLTVVDKPAGMLSVPGKLMDDSAYTRYRERHPEATGPIVVHRLDQETSGLLVFAKDKATHKALQEQFAKHDIEKCYIALLDGILASDEGEVELPMRPNVDDRPRQMIDHEHGRPAHTLYRVLARENGETRVLLRPLTGRTHQLRVHASHHAGLNTPIVGDRLYGTPAARLMLHAASITLTHPATGERITIESAPPF